MGEIPLSNGGVALVDDDAPPIAFQIAWHRKPSKTGIWYVRGRVAKKFGGHERIVYMHHLIMGHPGKGFVIDHINGNGLDNRAANLQLATHSRNAMRSPVRRGGVTQLHDSSRWRARIRIDGKLTSLGCYDTREEAQRAVETARAAVWSDPSINVLRAVL